MPDLTESFNKIEEIIKSLHLEVIAAELTKLIIGYFIILHKKS